MKVLAPYLPMIFIVLMAYPGYRLMKFKGYTGRRYLLLLFAPIPIFWIILGFVRTRSLHGQRDLWSYISIFFGAALYLLWLFSAISNPEQLNVVIAVSIVSVFGVAGYYLMKIKGHIGWNYLALCISSMPIFWIIFGLLKSNNERTDEKQLWSFVAFCWGLTMLYINYQSVHIAGLNHLSWKIIGSAFVSFIGPFTDYFN